MFSLWKKRRGTVPTKDQGAATQSAAGQRPTASFGLGWDAYEIAASVLTDVGCARETNEDCGRFVSSADPQVASCKGVLMLVADGVGGNSAGEVASRTAADVIGRVYYDHEGDTQLALVDALHAANRAIREAASADPALAGMGTTCSALAIKGGFAFSANVGDSRVYLVREGQIYLMTEDDSVVGAMVKNGLLTRAQARKHPDKNVIISALGGGPEVSIRTWDAPLPLRLGDSFVVCSDGLYDLVKEEEIREAVAADEPGTACARLVALAKERGGHDNITVGLLGVRPPDTSPRPQASETRELRWAQ
jgi:serine/threonine protein phosphatase PrpC